MSFKEKKRRGDHSSRYDTSEPLITYRENSNLPQKMESEDILVMLSDGAFDGFSQNGFGDGSTIFERNGCGTSTGDRRWII